MATFYLKIFVNPVVRGRAILEKKKISRPTPCTALATKDFYSCHSEAGQVYVFDVFFMILKLAEVRDCNDSTRKVVVILLIFIFYWRMVAQALVYFFK